MKSVSKFYDCPGFGSMLYTPMNVSFKVERFTKTKASRTMPQLERFNAVSVFIVGRIVH